MRRVGIRRLMRYGTAPVVAAEPMAKEPVEVSGLLERGRVECGSN